MARAGIFHRLGNFNSQPHEEADVLKRYSPSKTIDFNSQPHEEADDDWGGWIYTSHYFNSQPHEEADGNFAQKFLVQNCIFVTITYIVFSVHLLFDFLCIFSS